MLLLGTMTPSFTSNSLTYGNHYHIDKLIRCIYNVCIMNSVLLSIKTDSDTKEQVKAFAAELGVSSTAFVNMVVKQALRDRRVVLSTPLEPTDHLKNVMHEANADIKADKNLSGSFDNADDFFKDLGKNA